MGCQTGNFPQAAVLFDSSYRSTKKLLNPEIEELFGDPYGNRTHVTAVKGPCLNRLTNGPKRYRILLKQQATYQSRLQPAPKYFSETLH